MSRLARRPIAVDSSIKIDLVDNSIKLSKGNVVRLVKLEGGIKADIQSNAIQLSGDGSDEQKKFLGLARALITGAASDINEPYTKNISLVGVGFKCALKGNFLVMFLGYSHDIFIQIPQDITVTLKDATNIIISGHDRALVGRFCADIRKLRMPEPYKGKGVLFSGEKIRRKEGKKK